MRITKSLSPAQTQAVEQWLNNNSTINSKFDGGFPNLSKFRFQPTGKPGVYDFSCSAFVGAIGGGFPQITGEVVGVIDVQGSNMTLESMKVLHEHYSFP